MAMPIFTVSVEQIAQLFPTLCVAGFWIGWLILAVIIVVPVLLLSTRIMKTIRQPSEASIRKFEQESLKSGFEDPYEGSGKYGKREIGYGLDVEYYGKAVNNYFYFTMKPARFPKGFSLRIERFDFGDGVRLLLGKKKGSFSTPGARFLDAEFAKNYKITTGNTFKANQLFESGAFELVRKRMKMTEFESILISEKGSIAIKRNIPLTATPVGKDEIEDYAKFCEKICEKLEMM